jgi:hypothetical protein
LENIRAVAMVNYIMMLERWQTDATVLYSLQRGAGRGISRQIDEH